MYRTMFPLSLAKWLMGVPIAQSIYVLVKLGIPDLIGDQPASTARLAETLGVDADALHRLLRMLVSIGIVGPSEGDQFVLTAAGKFLRADSPGSLRHLALLGGEHWHLQPQMDLLSSVTTGKPAFELFHGMGFFEYLSAHPEAAALFDAAMESVAGGFLPSVSTLDLPQGASMVVDVGGGKGVLLASILRDHPQVRGMLVETPGVLQGASRFLAEQGIDGRCSCVAGDFLQSVPKGGDLYLLSHILHNWNDEQAVAILRNCRSAMHAAARLLVLEIVLGSSSDFYANWLDLEMLVNFGGRERTESEYRDLLERGGFRLVETRRTDSSISVLQCEPV
jgi:hypothetical protein